MSERPCSATRRASAEVSPSAERSAKSNDNSAPSSALEGAELSFDFADRSADGLTSAEARRVALQGRSDILSALGDYVAAEAELRLQIAKQYPDVHLSPGYQYDQGDNKWTLGIVREQLTTTDALFAAAQQQQQSAEAQLRAGATDPLDRMTVEFELGVAALARLDGRTAMQQSIGALEEALQRPVESKERTGSTASLLNTVQ